MSEEMETVSFEINGRQVSFRGYYLGSVSTVWDPVNQVERDEYDVFELYVDENSCYHLLHKKMRQVLFETKYRTRKTVQSHVACEDWQSLERRIKNTPASELLNLGLKAIH